MAAALFAGRTASAAPFTPGDLVVTRTLGGTNNVSEGAVGAPGSSALTGSGVTAAVYIDEYNPTGYYTGNTVILPYNTAMESGGNNRLTFSGTQNGEGAITLSQDGNYFVVAGYKASAYVTGVGSNGVLATTVNRTIGLIDMNGVYDTTTALQDATSNASIRSAYSTNGINIWVNGLNGGNVTVNSSTYTSSGVRFTTKGSTTSIQVQALSSNAHRVINGQNDQLTMSNSAAGTNRGVNNVGTGYPSGPGNTLTALPGTAALSETTDDFWFADAITMYTADQRTDTAGGIRKYRFEDTNADTIADTWVFKYNVTLGTQVGPTLGGNVGAHGIAGKSVDGVASIYAVTFDTAGANQNKLVGLSDLMAGTGNNVADQAAMAASLLTLGISAPNSAFRGVEVIPEPASIASMLAVAGLAAFRRRRAR